MQALVSNVPDAARLLAARFWPGPLTLVLPRSSRVPDEVTAGLNTVAIRVPAHPVARALLTAAGHSCRRTERESLLAAEPDARVACARRPRRSHRSRRRRGPTDVGVESTVLDLSRRRADDPAARRDLDRDAADDPSARRAEIVDTRHRARRDAVTRHAGTSLLASRSADGVRRRAMQRRASRARCLRGDCGRTRASASWRPTRIARRWPTSCGTVARATIAYLGSERDLATVASRLYAVDARARCVRRRSDSGARLSG